VLAVCYVVLALQMEYYLTIATVCSLLLLSMYSIPDHAYFEQYGPTFDLHTAPRRLKDCNTPETVQQLCAHIAATLEQVRCRRLDSEARAAAKTASTVARAAAVAAAAAASAAEAANSARAVTDSANTDSSSSSSSSSGGSETAGSSAAAVQAVAAVAPEGAAAAIAAELNAPELVQIV
jgi:hypothetical protein